MWQSITVCLIGIGVAVYLLYRLYRLFRPGKDRNDPCAGCPGCKLKNGGD
ncbi:MAG: FeoB-associated Cys-rich membrane protein [Dysgonamonadaceae bacterium]|nr:FeoB-associated Cys-rich membrane protein [Dysgonamonadaceae bacterium]